MKTNGHSHETLWTGWSTDERLRKYCIHLDVAQAIFDHGPLTNRREFLTPQQLFEDAEQLRKRQHHPTTLARILESGMRVFKKFTFTNRGAATR